ncbi:MAG: Crp/Fnr family transcriptional regulator [Geminicoccaceae bacterium]|nr:Crp/Fnr family transcriptional regulator [Geminicoccaceae bacterium]MDW8341852.1 Crp/Fnr family transcriptional regulator [Geminicoccaceae bacterium]
MDKLGRVREALADSDLFGCLTEDEIDRLLAFGTIVKVPAGKVIFQKGDPGDSLAVVISGRIRIGTVSPEGREAVLNFIEPGETFGEMAILDGKPRCADATAIEPCELFCLRRRDVLAFLEAHPEVALRVIGVLCQRLRRTTEMVEDANLRAMGPRVARALLRLAADHGRPVREGIRIELDLSQRELAAYCGLARENVNRQLSSWREAGLLRTDGRRLVLVDRPALERIAADGR